MVASGNVAGAVGMTNAAPDDGVTQVAIALQRLSTYQCCSAPWGRHDQPRTFNHMIHTKAEREYPQMPFARGRGWAPARLDRHFDATGQVERP